MEPKAADGEGQGPEGETVDGPGGDSGEGLGADLHAARPVTDLLDEVGTGRWQHIERAGALAF